MSGPLAGRRIVVTRSAEQADTLSAELRRLGAEPVLFPTVEFAGLPPDALLQALEDPGRYAWIIFTSGNAVKFFFAALGQADGGMRLPRLAATGPATAAELRRYGAEADFVPGVYTGETLGRELDAQPGQRVLLPRAKQGRVEIVEALRQRGVAVDDIPIYETVLAQPPPEAYAALAEGIDAITFTSPSTVQSFCQRVDRQLLAGALIACIGPTTAEAACGLGLTVGVVAAEHTTAGLARALVEHFSERS